MNQFENATKRKGIFTEDKWFAVEAKYTGSIQGAKEVPLEVKSFTAPTFKLQKVDDPLAAGNSFSLDITDRDKFNKNNEVLFNNTTAQKSVRKYTLGSDGMINTYLSGNKNSNEFQWGTIMEKKGELDAHIKGIDAGMSKSGQSFSLFAGMSIDSGFGQDLVKAGIGNTIQNNAYRSTSIMPSVAEGFNKENIFQFNIRKGTSMQSTSDYGNGAVTAEWEMLLGRGLNDKLIKIEEITNSFGNKTTRYIVDVWQ
jgi:hypothetical protein